MFNNIKLIVAISALVYSTIAGAVNETNKTVVSISSGAGNAFFNVTPALSTTCPYDLLYIINLDSSSSKAAYATLLAAKTSSLPLSRIDYYPNPAQGNRCEVVFIGI